MLGQARLHTSIQVTRNFKTILPANILSEIAKVWLTGVSGARF